MSSPVDLSTTYLPKYPNNTYDPKLEANREVWKRIQEMDKLRLTEKHPRPATAITEALPVTTEDGSESESEAIVYESDDDIFEMDEDRDRREAAASERRASADRAPEASTGKTRHRSLSAATPRAFSHRKDPVPSIKKVEQRSGLVGRTDMVPTTVAEAPASVATPSVLVGKTAKKAAVEDDLQFEMTMPDHPVVPPPPIDRHQRPAVIADERSVVPRSGMSIMEMMQELRRAKPGSAVVDPSTST